MEPSAVESIAQGRVYTGIEAKAIGLVDELGGLFESFRHAKILANMDPNRLYPIAKYKGDELSLAECLESPLSMIECMEKIEGRVKIQWSDEAKIRQLLGNIKTVLESDQVLAYWPQQLVLDGE